MNLLITNFKKLKSIHGQSAIEFAFVIPILMICVFGTLEFSAMFIESQRVSALSREAANAVYRECIGDDNAEVCVQSVVDSIQTGAGSLLQNFADRGAIIVTLHQEGEDPAEGRSGNPNAGTRLAGNQGIDGSIIDDYPYVAVAEVFYSHLPLTPFQKAPQEIYEVTVY